MKTIFKYTYVALVAVGALALGACSNDDYTRAEVSGPQVYFSNTQSSTVELDAEAQTFSIPVKRINADEALTVPVKVEIDEGLKVTCPNPSVSFEKGSKEAELVFVYDPADFNKLEMYDVYAPIYVELPEEVVNEYGEVSMNLAVGMPAPWGPWCGSKKEFVEAGFDAEDWPLGDLDPVTVTYTYSMFFSGEDPDLPIYYRCSKIDEEAAQFCIENCMGGMDFIIGYNPKTHDCTVEPQYINYVHPSYGKVYVSDVPNYQAGAPYTSFPCKYDPVAGRFTLDLVYFVSAGNFGHGFEVAQVGGFYVPDYSVAATCSGVLIDMNKVPYVQIVTELGVDAKTVKAYVAPREADAGAVADALLSGDVEGVEVVAGLNNIPLDGATGELAVILVSIAEDKAQDIVSLNFEYYAGASAPWKSLGKGLWTDDFIITMYAYTDDEGNKQPYPPITYEVEIMESTETPGLYRIMDAYDNDNYPYADDDCAEPGSCIITVDATDPDGAYIPATELGFSWGSGNFGIASFGGYKLQSNSYEAVKAAGLLGHANDKVITFPIIPFDANDPSAGVYQGVTFYGNNAAYAGRNGKVQVVLPAGMSEEAAAFASNMHKAKVNANKAARHLTAKSFNPNSRRVNKKLVLVGEPKQEKL